MSNLYNKNYNFLSKNKNLINSFDNDDDLNPVDIIREDDNNLFVERNNSRLYLNSAYDSKNEVDMTLKDIDSEVETVILFGLGNGEVFKELFSSYACLRKVVIVDPSIELFKTIMEKVDIEAIVSSNNQIEFHALINRTIDYSSKYLLRLVNRVDTQKMAFVVSVSYASLFRDYYNEFHRMMLIKLNKNKVNIMTRVTLGGSLWTLNTLLNLKQKHFIIEDLKDAFDGIPILLVMAGPSLNKNINLIEAMKKKCLVFAVGSAINILERRGIEPHIRIAFDGHPKEEVLFNDIKNENIPLFYGGQLFTPIIDKYNGPKVHFMTNSNYLERYVYKRTELIRKKFQSGFSIANTALDIACSYFKSKKVIFIGQDLSVTNKKYADGRDENNNLSYESSSYVKTKDVYGNEIYTNKQYLAIKETQERHISSHQEIEFINATEGGVGLIGTRSDKLSNILNEIPDYEVNISQLLNDIVSDEKLYDFNHKQVSRVLIMLNEEVNSINEILFACKQRLMKFEKLKKKNIKANRLQSELSFVRQKLTIVEENDFYKEVISEIVYEKYYAIEKAHYSKVVDIGNEAVKLLKKINVIDDYVKLVKKLLNR